MELIDRYVHQVGRRLPERTRADVKQELRSLLIDALEEHTGRSENFTEEEQVAVLEEFGPPETWVTPAKRMQIAKVARAYLSKQPTRDIDIRFDVLAVDLTGEHPNIRHVENAFWVER